MLTVSKRIGAGRVKPICPITMKPYTIFTLLIMVALAVIPPIDFVISNPSNEYWPWMIMLAGFAGIWLWFMQVNWLVKAISLGAFINCFVSVAPYLSFTAYCSIVLCCYFYVCASRIEDWIIVFKAAQGVLLLNILFFIMQALHKDTLLNFASPYTVQFGILGQHMQMASFVVIITALLINFSKINILAGLIMVSLCHSSWSFLCLCVGIVIYVWSKNPYIAKWLAGTFLACFLVWSFSQGKFSENLSHQSGRTTVWARTMQLSMQHPFQGFGIATYKDVFPPLSGLKYSVPWRTAHNFIAQLSFEVGFVATGCLLFALGGLVVALFKARLTLLLSGLIMIIMDALVHFPDRMIQAVPLIIIFLAYSRVCLLRKGLFL